MFGDFPADTPAGAAGAATGGGATCGIAGGCGAGGIGTLGAPICGIPEIGAAGGIAPGSEPRFEGVEIMRVYSLGPCAPLAGVAG